VNGKYGYIARTGRILIVPQYARAEDFSEGLAAVTLDNSFPEKWGYIDETGRLVIPPRFQEAGKFSDGVALVNPEILIEHAVFIDETGKEVLNNQQFISPKIKSVSFDHDFSEGLAAIWFHRTEGGSAYGYVNVQGQIVIDPQFSRAFDFREGVAEVNNFAKTDYRLLVDKTGRIVGNLNDLCPSLFAGEVVFSEGLAPAKTNCFADSWGFIDQSGQFVIKPQFASATIFKEDLAIVGFKTPSAAVPSNDSYFDGLRLFGDGGLAYTDMKYGYIYKSGVLVIPARFQGAGVFSEGLAAVKVNGKCGYIDKTGRLVIPAGFDAARPFTDGIASIRVGSRWGYIDKSGTYIWTPSK
jgi:hypothetical protein